MNRLISHLNILLVCCNILGLASYLFQTIINTHQQQYLVVIFLCSLPRLKQYAQFKRIHFYAISAMAVTATFLQHETLDFFLCASSLAYSTNLGYLIINNINSTNDEIKIKFYESFLNLSFSLSVFISIFNNYMQVSKLTAKIFILVTVLPNLYLSYNEETLRDIYSPNSVQNHINIQKQSQNQIQVCNKLIYSLNPLLAQSWPYALGYAIGIYINIFEIISIAKHIKYLIIALLILIQTLTYRQLIKTVCLFLRSILVFDYQTQNHQCESYFIFVYIILINFFHIDVINLYLMIGYVTISVIIWREDYRIDYRLTNPPTNHLPRENSSHTEKQDYDYRRLSTQNQIELPLLSDRKQYSLFASKREASL